MVIVHRFFLEIAKANEYPVMTLSDEEMWVDSYIWEEDYVDRGGMMRSISVINVFSLSSAYVQLRPNPRPDATVREKKQGRDSSWHSDPIGAVPRPFVSARL
ncbi:hypothetical protein F2Q68_00033991 [Brassica cretica]|nr:hypothetical protein F2Q68_00033991 [Brassica cretica]